MRLNIVTRVLAPLLCCVLSALPVSSSASRAVSSPLSDLKSKISGVEELLEEFRQQLQHEEQPYEHEQEDEQDEDDEGEVGEDEEREHGPVAAACLSRFDSAESHIIRAAVSIERGATFLSAPSDARDPADCLRACCAEPRCTVAVVVREERAAPRDGPRCYLFNCTYRGASVCAYSPQRGFTAYSRNGTTATTALRRPAEEQQQEEEEDGGGGEAWMRDLDEPPRSDAGQDVVVQLPTDWAILDGRDSIDDHGIMRYEWSLVKGDHSVNMKVTHPGLLKLSGLREGVYTFQLTIVDTIGQKSSDNVSVTVLAPEHHAEVCTRHCTRYQFMCDDGCCIDISYACDGKQQCPDRSDEDFCRNFDGGRKAVTHTSSAPSLVGEARESEGRAMIPSEPLSAETPVQPKQQQQQPAVSQDPCMEPPVVGPCRGTFPRWYYDAAAGECKHFLYGGCKGNRNNFLQQTDCVNECIQKPAPVDQQATAVPPPTTQATTATRTPSSEAKPLNSASAAQNAQPVAKAHTVLGGQPPPESGAILPLVLGVIISALLLLMVACRLRLVRHRMKKARPLTTEESDYLINGMYL
ncbi:low-density lipoprotein receptor-related protein 11 [Astyanax mexicanus]|uniref:Low-density lipoprotein receptor-related protein 11 n=1 Tax=Astyanax mexicanus TaxID=7994 RepID=A0A8B9JR63_ASTMX|nr:low-density lipoprotein receptor-related protein 11 [Astyanax mexicanus]